MKKSIIAIIAAMAVTASAASWTKYDMASYGTTAAITNTSSVASFTVTDALVTYDAATTNTLTVYVTKGGIDYKIGTDSVTNGQYSSVALTDVVIGPGEILKITTTDTNVNVLVRSE